MIHLSRSIKLSTYSFSNLFNLAKQIQINRELSHKKFQLCNQLSFSNPSSSQPRQTLQKNQIETRILKCISESNLIDLEVFRFTDDVRKVYYLDQFDVTQLVCSIQQEFGTVFDLNIFESVTSLDVLVDELINDKTIL